VLRVFEDATTQSHCIVSVLQPPADAERATRVQLPIDGVPEQAR
jgi:hypothetical protein